MSGRGVIGFIGSGNIGGTLARLAIDAGYHVVLSNSRGPETLSELVRALGGRARAATTAEASAAGELVVVTVPLKAYRSVPAQPLAGKLVLDTANYYPERDGRIPELEDGSATVSGLLQRHLPASQVVKAFNNIYFKHLRSLPRPAGASDRSALPIFGDDPAAKGRAARVLGDLGFDAVDGGRLDESWRSERDMPVYGLPYAAETARPVQGFPDEARPAGAATIRSLLAAARRSL